MFRAGFYAGRITAAQVTESERLFAVPTDADHGGAVFGASFDTGLATNALAFVQ